jgi:N-acetylglucosaminyl-diphospho-decaprenol L-rhamnosyltransferase
MSIAGVVVSHGAGTDLEECLAAVGPQVDELVVVANLPGEPLAPLPPGTHLIANEQPRGLAANTNQAIAATRSPFVVIANPDTRPDPGAVEALRSFMEGRPRCGVAGPQMRYPDGSWQPSRRRFPTVIGTVVRRTPLRLLFPPRRRQRWYYLLDERPSQPVQTDWMLGAFLLLRREMLDELGGFDEGFRLYGEDIDLCYRAAKAGWERWYVPQAVVRHRHAAFSDRRFLTRHTLWHWRSILRFVRKHPERLRAL